MKAWYNAKEEHEKRIIIILGIIVFIALAYLLVWAPLSEGFAAKNKQVKVKRELLAWMQKTGQEIVSLQGSSQGANQAASGPLLSTVDRTIKANKLAKSMKRLEPQGSDKVQIWFENTGFDPLVSWLGKIANNYQIHIETISIERQDQPGIVNARVILIRKSA